MSDSDPAKLDKLATKVSKVMAAIDHVPKSGYNDYHNYEYSSDDDVMQSLRPVLAEHNLAIFHNLVDRQIELVETQGGSTFHTRATIEVTLVDGDSGQSWTSRWEGEAQDGQDKGLYKAYTSGIKYWALKSFLLSADSDVETHDAAASSGAPQSRPSQEPTESQLEYARDLKDKPVWSDQELAQLEERIEEASKNELSNIIDNMKATIDSRNAHS